MLTDEERNLTTARTRARVGRNVFENLTPSALNARRLMPGVSPLIPVVCRRILVESIKQRKGKCRSDKCLTPSNRTLSTDQVPH